MSIPDTAIPVPSSQPAPPEARFRSEMGQISRHSAVFFLGTMFTAAAGYFFKIYVARMLGAAALGVYALGMTLIGFFGLFNGLGLPQTAVRFVAAYSATRQYERLRGFLKQTIGLLTAANFVLAGAMILVGPWLAINLYHSAELAHYLSLFAAILLLGAFTTFLGQVLAGYKDIALRTVITSFIGSPLNIVFGVLLLAAGWGLRGYVLAQVASAVIVVLMLTAAVWKLTPPEVLHFRTNAARVESEVFWFSAAAFGVSFLEFLLAQSDKIMLGMFLDVQQVGIYAVAASLVAFVPIALQSVNQIFSPSIADLHARGEQVLLGRIFQTLTKWIIGLTLPLAFVMMVYSRPLMRLFGPSFEAGWVVLVLGTIGQLINVGVGSVGYLLLMSGNQKRLVQVQTITAVFMVGTTFVLVRPFGIIGVALAAALTNGFTNYLCLKQVRAALHITPYNRTYLRLLGPCFASAISIAALRFLTMNIHPEWLMIGVALGLAYAVFGWLWLVIGLDNDDKMIVEAIRQRLAGASGRISTFR